MTARAGIVLVCLFAMQACKPETPADAAAVPTTGRGASSTDTSAAKTRGPSEASGGATSSPGTTGSRGGRAAAVITLAATDVATVQPTTIEDVTAISGDLRPIETVSVRSRLEGDLDAVLVREGEVVQPGRLLARFQSSEQESAQRSAEADRAAAKSDLANAQWNAEQSAQLFKAGAISQRDDMAAQQALVSAQAHVAAADARLRSTALAVRDTRVLSPTAGVVDKRLVENGEHVARGATMFSLVRNDVLELVAAMPSREATTVRTGQAVRFVADAKAFSGRVARISPTIDPVTRAVTVYVQIPNPSGALRGGTFATGQVITSTIKDVLAVPRDAIHQSPGSDAQFVYRIAGKAIDVAPVKTGVVDEHLGVVEVVEGLKAGDRIVSGNVGSLGRGMQVTVVGEDTGRGGGGRSGRRGAGKPR